MNPGTAANRLKGDLLWGFVQATGGLCYRCGGPMTRETFSVDHMEPWLDSAAPSERFFDPHNIAYSHLSCNVGDARRPHRKTASEIAAMPRRQRLRLIRGRRKYRSKLPISPCSGS